MKTAKNTVFYFLLLLCSVALLGCSQKADENKPISEVKAEAEKMNTKQLRATALSYKEAMIAKKVDIEKLATNLKDVPVTEMLGDEAKKIRTEMNNISKSVSALQERFDLYYNKLKEKGGDTSGLEK